MADDQKDPGQMKFNFRHNRVALFFLVAILGMFVVLLFSDNKDPGRVIDYSEFLNYLDIGQVQSVKIVDQNEIQGTLKDKTGTVTYFRTEIPYFDSSLVAALRAKNVRFSGAPRQVSPWRIALDLVPWVIGFLFIWFMFRQIQGNGNKAFSFGKSRAKRLTEGAKRVTFDDVAGQREAKHELQEVVEFLKNPAKFTRMGAKIPKGVLLVGMPGTGKTLLAKACAGEANVAFFHMSGSDFVEMFVGVGASRVRDLFEQGRKSAPCILFIDELDAVGRTRGAGYGGGHDEREQTLNQMLVEMDGFDTKDGVIVLAATNRPDVLDPALLRPGRFDRQVVVDMPDQNEREAILKIHASRVPLGATVDLNRLSRATPGASGADLANLVNEAALAAASRNNDVVEMVDFEDSRDKMLMGVARKSKVISPREKKATAYHESGHALLHYYLKNADPLHKVTVVPRGRALGVAISLPIEDTYSRNRSWLADRIKIAYGGYIAETIIYQETTTGTQNDLMQATEIARKMVTEWGMSDIGAIAFGQEDEPIFIGKEIARHKDYSEETARRIDAAVHDILRSCFDEAETILRTHVDELHTLAQALVERETLADEEVRELLHMAPRARDDHPELMAMSGGVIEGPIVADTQESRNTGTQAEGNIPGGQ